MKNLDVTKSLVVAGCAIALLVAGCASTGPRSVPEPAAPGPVGLQSEMRTLPRAEVRGEGITYPAGSLFSAGAALFYAGGTDTLGPLSALLGRYPQLHWEGTVRAESSVSKDHALALARMRSQLLRRYFRRQGIDAARITLGAEAGTGPDMILKPISPVQDEKDSSSSREKE